MSLYDYEMSRKIEAMGFPFYAIIMTAMRQADSENMEKLRQVFPDIRDELFARYNAPRGLLKGEDDGS